MRPTTDADRGTTAGELIRRSRADPDAFAVLFDRHALLLRQWIYAKTGDAAVANELLAETFAVAWRSAPRFRGAGEGSGEAWLYGIARNLVRQHHRHGRVQNAARHRLQMSTPVADDGGIDAATARIDAETLGPIIRAAFDELTPDQQQAVGYRVIAGTSYEELASHLNCSPVTARTRVHRGLRAMRDAIEKGNQP